jgi:hypothetical protein
MIDDIKSKIPKLLLFFLFRLVYKKLTKISIPMINARNKMIGNINTMRIPIAAAIPVHLSSLLAEFLLSFNFRITCRIRILAFIIISLKIHYI